MRFHSPPVSLTEPVKHGQGRAFRTGGKQPNGQSLVPTGFSDSLGAGGRFDSR